MATRAAEFDPLPTHQANYHEIKKLWMIDHISERRVYPLSDTCKLYFLLVNESALNDSVTPGDIVICSQQSYHGYPTKKTWVPLAIEERYDICESELCEKIVNDMSNVVTKVDRAGMNYLTFFDFLRWMRYGGSYF